MFVSGLPVCGDGGIWFSIANRAVAIVSTCYRGLSEYRHYLKEMNVLQGSVGR